MVEMATFFTKKLYLSRLRRRYVFGYIVVRIVNGFFGSNVHTLPWPTLAEKENELNPFREFTKGSKHNKTQYLSRALEKNLLKIYKIRGFMKITYYEIYLDG